METRRVSEGYTVACFSLAYASGFQKTATSKRASEWTFQIKIGATRPASVNQNRVARNFKFGALIIKKTPRTDWQCAAFRADRTQADDNSVCLKAELRAEVETVHQQAAIGVGTLQEVRIVKAVRNLVNREGNS